MYGNTSSLFLIVNICFIGWSTSSSAMIDSYQEPQFIQAVKRGNKAVVASLLPYVKVNAKDRDGNTAMTYAVSLPSRRDMVDLILSSPILDINMQDDDGNTPLMNAILYADSTLVKKLLDVPGIDITIKNDCGKTAIHLAQELINSTPHEEDIVLKYTLLKNFSS